MKMYNVLYGSWDEPEGIRVYRLFDRAEAFRKAEEIAKETRKVVTVTWDVPTSRGLQFHAKVVKA